MRMSNGQSSLNPTGSEDRAAQRKPDGTVAARAVRDGAADQRSAGACGKARGEVFVRLGTADDIAAILEIGKPQWSKFHAEPWNEAQVRTCCEALINEANAGLFILDVGGLVKGAFGIAAVVTPLAGVSVAVKVFWFVAPDAAGHGLKLMEVAEAWAKGYGVTRMQIDAPTDGVKVILRRRGYAERETVFAKEIV